MALAVSGLGVGLFTPPFFTAVLRQVSPQETGSAAGLLNAVQQLGGTLGVAVLGSIYLTGARPGDRPAGQRSTKHVSWIAAALLLATSAGTALIGTRGRFAEAPRPEDRRREVPARS